MLLKLLNRLLDGRLIKHTSTLPVSIQAGRLILQASPNAPSGVPLTGRNYILYAVNAQGEYERVRMVKSFKFEVDCDKNVAESTITFYDYKKEAK